LHNSILTCDKKNLSCFFGKLWALRILNLQKSLLGDTKILYSCNSEMQSNADIQLHVCMYVHRLIIMSLWNCHTSM